MSDPRCLHIVLRSQSLTPDGAFQTQLLNS
jgi:hypothetical protein